MNKVERLEKYISDFFLSRWQDFIWFWKTTHRDRQQGIYLLKDGNLLMDLLFNIKGNVEDYFLCDKLIPQRFATPEALFAALTKFKNLLNRDQYLLDKNFQGEDTDFIVYRIQEFKDELIQMIDYCKQVYDVEDTFLPYQELRYSLIKNDVQEFIRILKSILSSVSYAISKTKEGYYHSNVHLILKLLGFDVIAEEQTNNGRIDAVIRFIDRIHIVEFKFSRDQNKSQEALQQIISMDYANKFYIEKKEVIGIGISFDTESRNINGFQQKLLIAGKF
jgi:hypothetical protein